VKDPTRPGKLITRVQIREILGVSKTRVQALEDTPDFPAPIDAPLDGHGRPIAIFDKAEIEEYAAHRSTAAGRRPAPDTKS
jgi:hypothetical protein